MIYAFWLSVLVTLSGLYGLLQGLSPTGCRLVMLSAMGATLAILIIMGGILCAAGIPIIMLMTVLVALSET